MIAKIKCCLASAVTMLIIGTGCQPRSLPTENPLPQTDQTVSQEQIDNKQPQLESIESKDTTLLGTPLHRHASQAVSVTVYSVASKEIVFQTADDVLTRRFQDSIYIVNKTIKTPISAQYRVELHLKMGQTIQCDLQVDESQSMRVLVEYNGAAWEVPTGEGAWLRTLLAI